MKLPLMIALFLLRCTNSYGQHVALPGLIPGQKVAGKVKSVKEYWLYAVERNKQPKDTMKLVSEQLYNEQGKVTYQMLSDLVYGQEMEIRFYYNNRGEENRKIVYFRHALSYPDEGKFSVDSNIYHIQYTYNNDSTIKTYKDESNSLAHTYNKNKQIIKSTNAELISEMKYHDNGELSETRMYTAGGKSVTLNRYDKKGQAIEWQTPGDKYFYYAYSKYDAAGNWTEVICTFINKFDPYAGSTPEYDYTVRRDIEYYK